MIPSIATVAQVTLKGLPDCETMWEVDSLFGHCVAVIALEDEFYAIRGLNREICDHPELKEHMRNTHSNSKIYKGRQKWALNIEVEDMV